MGTKRSHDESAAESKGKAPVSTMRPSSPNKKQAIEQDTVMTVEETKLYDRQIRLWGLEAQTRMRRSNILIIGCTGLTNEVLKNLVLAGIGSVTVMESRKVSGQHLGTQFFGTKQDIGRNLAETVIKKASLLNPSVRIQAEASSVHDKPDEFFTKFDLVCLIGQDVKVIDKVNQICHKKKIPFWSSSVNGLFGYIFCDLVEHSFVEEQKLSRKGEPDTVQQRPGHAVFSPWKDALAFKFDSLNTTERRFRRKAHPLYFAYLCMWRFQELHGRLPDEKTDEKALLDLKLKVLEEVQCNPDFVPDNTLVSLAKTFSTELGPACAVMGGLLAQEVLKVLSRKEAPFNNIMVYDSWEPAAFVMKLSSPSGK